MRGPDAGCLRGSKANESRRQQGTASDAVDLGVNISGRLVCRQCNAAFRPVLDGVHLMISNLKTWLLGRFHGVSRKYLPAYVAEFMYRFNRRRSPPDLFGWVTRRLMTRTALTLGAIQSTADVCA
jgi:hypothetical protein